jgi:bifunctional non-homologous end joining protein LigD
MGTVAIGGRSLSIGNLERVIFPASGVTKARLLDYYVRIAPVMLPHLRGRQLHMHRYPEGVGGPSFWQKGCPEHKPDWVPTVAVWSRDKRADIEYCVIDEVAALLWAVNIGSLELHTSLHTREDLHRPTALAFDLDPGDGVDVLACARIALRLREVLDGMGFTGFVKTSGSKGLQVYARLDGAYTYADTKPLARAIAEALESRWPELVVSRMARALRRRKVLIDWSQNTEHKSMVCAYSVRARERPTVSTPVTWEEVEAARAVADLRFELDDVLDRVAEHGDLFSSLAERAKSGFK